MARFQKRKLMIHSKTIKDLSGFTKRFDVFLKRKLTKEKDLLNSSISYSLFSGGKRFRPYLIFLFGKEYKLSSNVIMNLAAAVEMLHNYSLVHDDLPAMDNDKYRRGKKTTHYRYNEFIAILAGCGLLTKTYENLSNKNFKLSDNIKLKLIERLTKISGERGLLKGQYLDLSINNKSIAKRIEINRLKTGKLMSYCCSAVGIASKKNKIIVNRLSKVGLYIGEIFQINDDLEDYPRMKKKDKFLLLDYKTQLYKKTINELRILRVKSRQIYLLIDFLIDLKV